MAETLTQQQPQAQAPAKAPEAQAAPIEVPKDLSQRLSQPVVKEAQKEASPAQDGPTPIEISLDDIKDPVQRSVVQKALETKLKQANDAISRKFGEFGAEKSKLLQEKQAIELQLEQAKNKHFTVQDIQQMVNRPDFIQAAQAYQQQLAPEGWNKSAEEWSNLSESEKSMVANALREAQSAKAQVSQMQLSHLHNELRSQYTDYNPAEVESIITRANTGQMTQKEIFELTYKALKAEEMAKRAYQLGYQDSQSVTREKVGGASMPNGIQTQVSSESLQRLPNEPSRSFFKRVAEKSLASVMNRK